MNRSSVLRRKVRLLAKTALRRFGARAEREKALVAAFRAEVVARANGRCQRCGDRALLIAHHMVRRSSGLPLEKKHDPALGAALCRPCHGEVHDHIGEWRRWFR